MEEISEKELKEFWDLTTEIKNLFNPIDDRDCPDLREKILHSDDRNYKSVKEVNLFDLSVGSDIYFVGQQFAAYYTLHIVEDQKVKAWRNVDSNALLGPIDRIISRNIRNTLLIKKGFLKVHDGFIMPYFNYEEKNNMKFVLQPNTCYMGGCMRIFLREKNCENKK